MDSCLSSVFQNIELIIVNNGSTNRYTKNLRNKSKTRMTYQENKGLLVAQNAGNKEVKGNYIFPLHADDKIPQP